MLCREIIAVCSEIHTKHINTLCGQNVELLNVKPGGTYSNQWDLKGKAAYRRFIQLGFSPQVQCILLLVLMYVTQRCTL
jgi:hypothetical protein